MAGSKWSIPYGPPALDPIWGPQTSAVNFCEEVRERDVQDYIVTKYIGEFWNTVTSAIYILYGIHGLRRFKRQDVTIFDVVNLPYWGLIGVGIFSGLYHTSLKYHTQMSDELSMHLAIGTVMHRVFTFEQPLATQRKVTALILGVLVPFFIYHCVADEFVLHVILFLGMVILITWKTRSIISARVPSEADRRKLANLVHFGSFCAALAYGLWNIDVNFCGTLTRWKHALGMPWGIALEFHGYWHILTSITAYNSMAIIEYLTSQSDESAQGVGFAWPSRQVLRDIAAGGSAIGITSKNQRYKNQ